MKKLLLLLFAICCMQNGFSQGMVDSSYVGAGQDVYTYSNVPVKLYAKGAASYTWQPSSGVNNDTIAQPYATASATTTYTLYYKLSKEDTIIYQSITHVNVVDGALSAASCTNWVNNGDMESGACPPNQFGVLP